MKQSDSIVRGLNSIPLGCSTLIMLCIIAVLTLMPSSDVPHLSIPYADKVMHFMMFGALSTVIFADGSRHRGHADQRVWIVAAVVATALGGVIEILQSVMGMGRGAEWADFIADGAGAFLLPLAFRKTIVDMTDKYALSIRQAKHPSAVGEAMRRLYFDSFPADERRPWDDILDKMAREPRFHFDILESQGRAAGFISWWRLESCIYVEHFAVDPAKRGNGLGAKAIRRFCSKHGTHSPIVLEVELPGSNDMADRRIGFYKRCGFTPHAEFEYRQPAYSPELQPVALMLMTYGKTADIGQTAREIRSKVYRAE